MSAASYLTSGTQMDLKIMKCSFFAITFVTFALMIILTVLLVKGKTINRSINKHEAILNSLCKNQPELNGCPSLHDKNKSNP